MPPFGAAFVGVSNARTNAGMAGWKPTPPKAFVRPEIRAAGDGTVYSTVWSNRANTAVGC